MEGRYKINSFAHKTDSEAETGTITNPEKDRKIEKNEKHHTLFQKRFPSFTKNLYEYFVEYSSSSTIQGLSYMGEKSRPVFERVAWLFFFCISLYLCITLIDKTYVKWNTSPVLVSFATKTTAVWKVPFPAFTICPDTKARHSVYNFTQNYYKMYDDPGNMTDTEMKRFADLAIVCDGYHHYQKGNLTTGYDTIEFLMEAAPEFSETIWVCKYPLSHASCQNLFTPILTEEGICYTFNMLDRSEIFRDNVFQYRNFMSHGRRSNGWTLQTGYPKDTPINTYPRRTVSAGFQTRFAVVLKNFVPDMDYMCKGPIQGFKIILHHPAEVPRLGLYFVRVQHEQELTIAIKPDMITTSEDLRNYDPHRRQCYFPEERRLAFYRIYTQKNCDIECLTNFTRNKCECVGFQMPHEKGTPICGSGSKLCMHDAQDELLRREVESIMDKEESDLSGASECDCLPGCTSLVYNAETTQAQINRDIFLTAYGVNISEYEGVQFTRINILFKEQQFITSERNELYGSIEFLSNCGGILGLFTGFSFLSLVEILYFLSLRLFCNIKRYGKHYWSGSQELVSNEKYDHEQ